MGNNIDESQTEQFLKKTGVLPFFDASDEAKQLALASKSKSEAFLILQSSRHGRQNDYLIEDNNGIKRAMRVFSERLKVGDARFERVESAVAPWEAIRQAWTCRRRQLKWIGALFLTLVLLPFVSSICVEWVKYKWHWNDAAPAVKSTAVPANPGIATNTNNQRGPIN